MPSGFVLHSIAATSARACGAAPGLAASTRPTCDDRGGGSLIGEHSGAAVTAMRMVPSDATETPSTPVAKVPSRAPPESTPVTTGRALPPLRRATALVVPTQVCCCLSRHVAPARPASAT